MPDIGTTFNLNQYPHLFKSWPYFLHFTNGPNGFFTAIDGTPSYTNRYNLWHTGVECDDLHHDPPCKVASEIVNPVLSGGRLRTATFGRFPNGALADDLSLYTYYPRCLMKEMHGAMIHGDPTLSKWNQSNINTVEVRVDSQNSNCYATGTVCYLPDSSAPGSTSLTIGHKGAKQWDMFARIKLSIPKNATIVNARAVLTAKGNTGPCNVTLRLINNGNVAAFTTTPGDPTNPMRTNAGAEMDKINPMGNNNNFLFTVPTDPPPHYIFNNVQQIVQAFVNMNTYAPGNYIGLCFESTQASNPDPTDYIMAEAFNDTTIVGGNNVNVPTLYIRYVDPGVVPTNDNYSPPLLGGQCMVTTNAVSPCGITLDAGASFLSYQWSTGEISQTIGVTAIGDYTVTVTKAVTAGDPPATTIKTGTSTLSLTSIRDSGGNCVATSSVTSSGDVAVTVTVASSGSGQYQTSPFTRDPVSFDSMMNPPDVSQSTGFYRWFTMKPVPPLASWWALAVNGAAPTGYDSTAQDRFVLKDCCTYPIPCTDRLHEPYLHTTYGTGFHNVPEGLPAIVGFCSTPAVQAQQPAYFCSGGGATLGQKYEAWRARENIVKLFQGSTLPLRHTWDSDAQHRGWYIEYTAYMKLWFSVQCDWIGMWSRASIAEGLTPNAGDPAQFIQHWATWYTGRIDCLIHGDQTDADFNSWILSFQSAYGGTFQPATARCNDAFMCSPLGLSSGQALGDQKFPRNVDGSSPQDLCTYTGPPSLTEGTQHPKCVGGGNGYSYAYLPYLGSNHPTSQIGGQTVYQLPETGLWHTTTLTAYTNAAHTQTRTRNDLWSDLRIQTNVPTLRAG